VSDRTPFKTIQGKRFFIREVTADEVAKGFAHRGDLVLASGTKIVAIINPDYIYDQYGNRFSF